jgi:hypothetical protein
MTVKVDSLAEVAVRDPLSETTRKERRGLLGVGIVIICIIKTGMLPTKIEALGIEFSQTDQKYLFHILAAVVIYYLAAFLIYAVSDFILWKIAAGSILDAEWTRPLGIADENKILTADEQRIKQLERQLAKLELEVRRKELTDRMGLNFEHMMMPNALIGLSGTVSLLRGIFEFLLPLVVGGYALFLILMRH